MVRTCENPREDLYREAGVRGPNAKNCPTVCHCCETVCALAWYREQMFRTGSRGAGDEFGVKIGIRCTCGDTKGALCFHLTLAEVEVEVRQSQSFPPNHGRPRRRRTMRCLLLLAGQAKGRASKRELSGTIGNNELCPRSGISPVNHRVSHEAGGAERPERRGGPI